MRAAILLTGLASCIWPEPVNPNPAPSDQAPSIQIANPLTHQIELQESGGSCTVSPSLPLVVSPQNRPLFAEFWLNYLQTPSSQGQQLFIGQADVVPLQQSADDPTSYTLHEETFDLLRPPYVQGLLPSTPGGPSNLLWVFVSDGFAASGPDPVDASHYTTSFVWQIVPTPECLDQLNQLTQ